MDNELLNGISLATEAEPTGRLLGAPYMDYHDAAEGEEYQAEWSAEGEDERGRKVKVYWIQTEVKGQELEPEDLDWDTVDRVEYL